ncbi:uncharacterized protein FIESC28_02111 [Fusarium coffeatum]|uniref:Uncharacterized protein n=1 Tax=Fusarium coffeatum TaxID=231269 RepID=A0A366S793_9HYPO|nr:uncharacterized protein FIESC28_02111 [Fusarium coffeatum]RBR25203.1 hypothetical protein FIESC28_02111 [Fusarium coffeatum]
MSVQNNPALHLPARPLPPRATRTAQMPMAGGDEQMRLIDICARGKSLYELYLQLPKLASDLENDEVLQEHSFSVESTIEAIKYRSWTMFELMHSMSPRVIRSIVAGTVAHDDQTGKFNSYDTPNKHSSANVPGVYVIGLSRYGEDGKFLNIREMELLIRGIEKYIAGYHAYVKFQNLAAGAGLSDAENDALRHLRRVDEKAGGKESRTPVFIDKEERVPRIEALLETLRSMCDPTLDPTKLVRIEQSPLYVGCSQNLEKRMGTYGTNCLKDINKPLGLTVAIMRSLKLPVKLHVRNVIRTWKPSQLPVAEQLVTCLASSLVYQRGFNSTEAGGTGVRIGPNSDWDCQKNLLHVMSTRTIFKQNLGMSLEDLRNRKEFIDELAKIRGTIPQIQATMEECQVQLRNLPVEFRWNTTTARLEQLLQKLRKELEDKKKVLQFWNLISEIQVLARNLS